MLKGIFLTILIFSGCLVSRATYTYKRLMQAVDIVSLYTDKLIKSGQYDMDCNYYRDMIFEFYEYLLDYKLWGKYSAIKPKYRKILEPYIVKAKKG